MAVLLILACLWAVVLVPPLLRARTDRSGDSIGDFNYRLDVLSRTNGTAAVERGAPPLGSAAKRRRDVLRVLVAAVTLTMLLAFVSGLAVLWAVNIVADLMLVAYLLAWAWVRSAYNERMMKVRYLPQADVGYLDDAGSHDAGYRTDYAPSELARTGSSY